MPPATFIDANVPIYAAGREHPYREPCIRVLAAVNDDPGAFFTDAEVFQEIVHHYPQTDEEGGGTGCGGKLRRDDARPGVCGDHR